MFSPLVSRCRRLMVALKARNTVEFGFSYSSWNSNNKISKLEHKYFHTFR